MVTLEKQVVAYLTQTSQKIEIAVENPVTGQVIGSISIQDEPVWASGSTCPCCCQPYPAWEALGVKARAKLIRKWSDMLWEDRKNAIAVIRRETGKTELGAWEEVVVTDTVVSYYCKHAARFLRPQTRHGAMPVRIKRDFITRRMGWQALLRLGIIR